MPLFDYQNIFENPKRFGKVKGTKFSKVPASIDAVFKKFIDGKVNFNNYEDLVGFAKENYAPGTWYQNMLKICAVLNCNIDPAVFQKLDFKLDEEKHKILVLNLIASSNTGKNNTVEKRALQKNKAVAEKLWDKEQHEDFVQSALDANFPLVNKEILTTSEMDSMVQLGVILMYYYMPNIRCLYWSITKNHATENYIVEQQNPIVGKLPMYFNFYRHKGTFRKNSKPIVHEVSFQQHENLYNVLKKLIALSDENECENIFFDYIHNRPFTQEEFRKYVFKCHGDIGTYLLRVGQIVNKNYGDVQSLAQQHMEAAQRGHTKEQDESYIPSVSCKVPRLEK